MYKNHKKSTLFLMCLSVLLIFSVIKIYAEQWEPVPWVTQEILDAGYSLGGEGCQVPLSICVDPIDGNFLLYGSDVGGMHRSLNGGVLWESCNIGYNPRGSCCVTMDPNNINRLLAVGANSTPQNWHGIYLSINKGQTWENVFLNNTEGHRDDREQVAYDKSSYDPGLGYSKIAYWSTDGSETGDAYIYKSIDGGETWFQLSGSSLYANSIIKVHPVSGYVYTANSTGFYKSINGGTNFALKFAGNVTGLDVVNTAPDNVYICTSSEIYISTDNGENFSLIPSSGFPFYNLRKIKVSPVNTKKMVIENDEGQWRWYEYYTINGGTNWAKGIDDDTYSFVPNNNRRSIFAWHPTDENVVWSFGGDFVTKSEDGGATWEWANNGNNAVMVGGMFNFNTQDPDLIYVGSQDYNGAVTTNAGRTWKYVDLSQLNWGGYVYGAYAATPDILFAGKSESGSQGVRTLTITRDGGETIIDTGIELSGANVSYNDPDVSYGDPTDPDVLFCFDYRSDDQGLTWSQMSGCDGVLTSNPTGARELYGRNDGKIVKSIDKGETWTEVVTIRDDPARGIRDLAYDHVHNRIYAVANWGRLYQYNVDSDTLINITSSIPLDQFGEYYIRTVAVDPVNPDIVYTGSIQIQYASDVSVVRSTDAGMTWEVLTRSERFNNEKYGMDGGREADCIRVHPVSRYAYVSTSCYGIWKIGPPDGVSADTTPPYTTGHNPVDGALGVNIDTDIEVQIRDSQSGVDISSIVMTIEGEEVIPDITGASNEYTVIYNPSTNFGYNQEVNVTIDASDLGSNVMTQDSYLFTTESETLPLPEAAHAYKTSSSITIDGDLTEWQGIDNGIKIGAGDVIEGTINDDNDCSGMFYALWDANYLYIACEITDDLLVADSGTNYHDDSVEIYVDGGHEALTNGYDSNDHQYIIDKNNRITDQGETNSSTIEDVLHAVQTTSNGYIVEVAIPYNYLGINPTNNQIIGYDLAINDDDDVGNREAQSLWSNSGDDPWNYASSFCDLVLSSNVFSVDTTPPYTAGHNPVKGATNVNIDTDIEVHISDTQSGVDISTIVMTVEGEVVTPDITGTSSEYVVIYNPTNNFGYEQEVNVTINASDLGSNAMTQDSYSFTTESTLTPPPPEAAQAYKTSSSITIDGDLTEWQGIDNGIKIGAGDVIEGTITNDNDSSGMFYALWDANYLYIACEITDDLLAADSDDIWEDDSVEIYVDGGHEATNGYDSNDHQYIIDKNNRITDQGETNSSTIEDVLHAVQTTSNGYIVEVAIPYNYLGINPTNNQIIGYDLAINDDDDGGNREAQSFWSNSVMEPPPWVSASSFSDLLLSANVFTPDPIVPGKPKIIHIKAISGNKIELAWNSVSLATSYTLFRSLNNSVNDSKKIVGFSAGKTNYTDTSLTKNTTYYYWLKAYNIDGESGYSAEASVKTLDIAGNINLDNLLVGPNPFKPNSSGGNEYIIFANLTKKAKIKVHTILGKLIVVLQEKDGDGIYKWDGKRNNGKALASGVYICHITNPQGESKFVKLLVIR